MKLVGRLLAGLVLALAVPAAAAPSLDGYSFERPEFEHDNIQVVFIKVHSQAEMARLAGTFHLPSKGGTVKAFSMSNKNGCVIYAEDPSVDYEPEFLGHELTHCIFGNFHPKQSEKFK